VQRPFTHQRRRSTRERPRGTPRARAMPRSSAEATANRSATPANGGIPANPNRIAAQVDPQMRMIVASAARRTVLEGTRPYG
jgi:hypothetical protein